jgi:hypothetical protein
MASKDENEENLEAAPKRASSFQLWLEEAWEGWLKSVGVIFLCAVAYVLYNFGLVGEGFAGVVAVALIILGSVFSTVMPAWHILVDKPPAARALFVTFVAMWLVGTGYPALRTAMPPAPVAEGVLTAAAPSVKLKTNIDGPYELTVSGGFKQPGVQEAEINYSVKAEGGGGSDEAPGTLKRSLMHLRASRRGGTTTTLHEQTELTHPLPHVRGNEVTLSTDSVDEQLAEGLHVAVRKAGPNPLLFLILGALAVLLAIGFDTRLYDPRSKTKVKTYLAPAAGICLAFSLNFPIEATPHSLVRPAVGGLVFALFTGGLGGWLLSVLARGAFGIKAPKKAKR